MDPATAAAALSPLRFTACGGARPLLTCKLKLSSFDVERESVRVSEHAHVRVWGLGA
jgi:hypothetical protein